MRNRVWAIVFCLLVVVGAVSSGAGRFQPVSSTATSEGIPVSNETADYRAGLTVAETFTSMQGAPITAIPDIFCGGFQTVAAPIYFSSSGANVVLTCVRFHSKGGVLTFTGAETRTITAGTIFTTGGLFIGTLDADFSTRGASLVKILVQTAPSAGSVTIGPPAVY